LSESAFAMFLNMEKEVMERLKYLSNYITIVTGGLYFDGKDSYNSTYYFINGRVQIANKVVLVPFGEEVPLPKFISKYINRLIYDGAEDYIAASKPVDIDIKGEKFRNAICYEATRDELFVENPKFMIAISNNAWFTPSIEPTLQYLLLRYYSRKYHTTIFHSANIAKSALIRE
jgi:apolipoprotein N-acyltransferase